MKKTISFILALAMVFSLVTMLPAYADSMDELGDTTAERVPELAQITEEEIDAMGRETANEWFSKAFPTVDPWILDEISVRNSLKTLACFENYWQNRGEALTASAYAANAVSTQGSHYYSGEIGVAWVRDFNKSPLTLSETVSLTYSFEFDWICRSQLATWLALQDKSFFEEVATMLAEQGMSAAVAYVISLLGATGLAAVAIAAAVSFYFNVVGELATQDMERLNSICNTMSDNQYMNVKYAYYNNYMIKDRYIVSRTNIISNPCPGVYGFWYDDEYCVKWSTP